MARQFPPALLPKQRKRRVRQPRRCFLASSRRRCIPADAGKAGGVKLAKTADEAETIARQMLGMQLVTKQTGPCRKTVHKVLITEAVAVKKEYYLSVTGDMNRAGLVIVAVQRRRHGD